MKFPWKTVLRVLGLITALGLASAVGYRAAGTLGSTISRQADSTYATGVNQKAMEYAGDGGVSMLESAASPGAPPAPSVDGVTPPVDGAGVDRLIVRTVSMSLRVKDVDGTIAAVRRIATTSGSEVANLVMTSGESAQPKPIAAESVTTDVSGPADAQIVLRIPSQHLTDVEQRVARLGVVVAQSASQDDVTQQHVDMTARLKNLQAEEARLRTFLRRTDKVSELLVVERELARVRGDIESMQAQLQYLERQAAMATLTIALAEPGPVVSPGTGGWGLGQAVRDGIRITATLVRVIITIALPLALVAALAGIVMLAYRSIRRKHSTPPASPASPPSPEHPREG